MGEARLGRVCLAVGLAASGLGAGRALAQSRFLSYQSESECVAGGLLGAPLCRSAFANARMEFAAHTPSFPSLTACAKAFGACAPWPPGTTSRASFRPRWVGVDIVDTPKEKTVTPSPVPGPRTMSFAPQPLTEFRSLDVRGAHPSLGLPFRQASRPGSARPFGAAEPVAPSGSPSFPPPGSGFKLEDGVLTYPAPSRFLPKNLPKQP